MTDSKLCPLHSCYTNSMRSRNLWNDTLKSTDYQTEAAGLQVF